MKKCGFYRTMNEHSTKVEECGNPPVEAILVRVYGSIRDMEDEGPTEPAVLMVCEEHGRGR